MKIYLVGGAIRDKMLKSPIHDKDYVVIGATVEEMVNRGFKRVGKSFPVFLHPETGEEYALARKEIKTGPKHQDFKFVFTPDITLKEDSERRDFTCNAIYEDINTGEIIDFHHGKDDIKNKILRHISEHFTEDPLRVLRACRFAAQLNFTIAPETLELCKQMVQKGDLNHLSADRIWQELEKALSSPHFVKFMEIARQCGVLKIILPEAEQLFSVPERLDYHPEGNSGKHTLLALKVACTSDSMVNYAILLHDIGKTKTDPKCWPSHRGHDKLGEDIIKAIGKRLRVPSSYTNFAKFTAVEHMIYHSRISEQKKDMVRLAIYLSNFNHKNYEERFIEVLKADMQGRDKEVSAEETKNFAEFERYLHQLVSSALENKTSEIPDFEKMIEGIKKGIISPSVLNEAYIEYLLSKNPYQKI